MDEAQRLAELVARVTALGGYTRAVGTRVVRVETGAAEMAVDRRPDLLQYSGYFHGGVVSGLADYAGGAAVTTALPAGRIAMTVDLHVTFLAPADGQAIVARARAVRAGGTIGVATVEVVSQAGADERLCAIATGTFRIIDMPAGHRQPPGA